MKVEREKQYGHPLSEEEAERVFKIVTQPGYRRINKSLPATANEADRAKYKLCKSIVRYAWQNNLSEEELKQKLEVDQVKLEYVLFCHIDNLIIEELINYISKLTGRLEMRVYYGQAATIS
jgi:predicted XRE-type DNA-binding protein